MSFMYVLYGSGGLLKMYLAMALLSLIWMSSTFLDMSLELYLAMSHREYAHLGVASESGVRVSFKKKMNLGD